MNLLYIGHSVEDYIYQNGEIFHKPGGIFYSIAAVKSFLEKTDKLTLLSCLAENTKFLFDIAYECIDTSKVKYIDKIPEVHLKVYEDKEREETYKNMSDDLDIHNQGVKFEEYNGIFLNMVSGFDITLNDLVTLRQNFGKTIFMDVHTMSRGLDENFQRGFRVIPQMDEWLKCVDILQCNETEFTYLFDLNTEDEILNRIFDCGVKIFLQTLGDKGVRVFYKASHEIKSYLEDPLNVKSINSVGCGDSFGSIFFYHYIKTSNLSFSVKMANKAAGMVTTYEDVQQFMSLKNDIS